MGGARGAKAKRTDVEAKRRKIEAKRESIERRLESARKRHAAAVAAISTYEEKLQALERTEQAANARDPDAVRHHFSPYLNKIQDLLMSRGEVWRCYECQRVPQKTEGGYACKKCGFEDENIENFDSALEKPKQAARSAVAALIRVFANIADLAFLPTRRRKFMLLAKTTLADHPFAVQHAELLRRAIDPNDADGLQTYVDHVRWFMHSVPYKSSASDLPLWTRFFLPHV